MEYLIAIIPLAAIVVFLVLLIWALVDAIKSDNEPVIKLIWVLVILFMPILGSLIYLVAGRKKPKTVKKTMQ
ncbi:MAG TPA: PLD nuclease N-terminal domain-containing protein [Syntrophorhabdaceae bacterium]|nr:PLD nuclease N-terminal domain-containing protein [Pseudomonadota bacterium]HOS59465.1 PLD nuclease N-terminal domain-containing protein [Syntrophorhabdaceae bacterium]